MPSHTLNGSMAAWHTVTSTSRPSFFLESFLEDATVQIGKLNSTFEAMASEVQRSTRYLGGTAASTADQVRVLPIPCTVQ